MRRSGQTAIGHSARPHRGVVAAAFVAGAAIAGSRDAAAQACSGGRVASDLTRYQCCWRGQVWSDATNACSGPPICPTTFSRVGDECVPPALPTIEYAEVSFEAPRRREAFTLLNASGDIAAVCTDAPCMRTIAPGDYTLVLDSRWNYARRRIVVPRTGLAIRDAAPPASGVTIALLTGGALASASALTSFVFALLRVQAYSYAGAFGVAPRSQPGDFVPLWVGVGCLVTGLSSFTAAIVVRRSERIQIHSPAARLLAGLDIAPTPGGGYASLTVRFAGL